VTCIVSGFVHPEHHISGRTDGWDRVVDLVKTLKKEHFDLVDDERVSKYTYLSHTLDFHWGTQIFDALGSENLD